VLGEMQLTKAAGLSARLKLREMLTPLMSQAQQTMPKELADATLENQMKEALTAADTSFKDASDHLTDVVDGPGSDRIAMTTKKAAILARIFVDYGQQQLALLQANQAAADAAHKKAVEDVQRAANEMQVTFPTLPGDLAAAIPPPPAPPATAPAEAATTAPTETAAADSPDVQAIRVVVQSFLDALDKGDADAVKAVCQIDPGQEETVNQLVTVVTEGKKFVAAAQEKFGPAAAMLGNMVNIAAAMQTMKTANITVNGDDGMITPPNGGPPKKQFVRVDGQWKIYVGVPDESEKPKLAQLAKLNAALPTLTADIQAGKYASMPEMLKALGAAIGAPGATPAENPPTPPATPQ
jgi:hypothetical protein